MESSEDHELNEREEDLVEDPENEDEAEMDNETNAIEAEPELLESSSEFEFSDTDDTEDIDKAYVRLSTKTKFGTEQTEKEFETIDPFDDDLADLKVLLAKPTCFLVLGKPGSGKTSVARKLANFWRCQLITPTDCLEQAIQQNSTLGVKAQQILQRGEVVNDELVIQIIEERLKSPECEHYGYILDGFPCLSEEYMSFGEQMSMLKNLTLKPDVIINLRIPDMDLVSRRSGIKVDPMTNISYPKDKYAPEKGDGKKKDSLEEADEGAEEEEGNEEEEEEQGPVDEEDEYTAFDEDSGDLEEEVVQRLVTRPEDFPENVSASITKFKDELLTPIEDLMSDHEPQNLIEINGILNEKTVFRQIMLKLTMLSFRPAIVPMRLHGSEEEELPEEMDSDELFRQMAPVNHPGPRWRWRRSRWGRFCPVALREGNIQWGKPDFGVSFLDKMFFLSSEEAMKKFLKNPRQFLLPPQPRPPCRFSVVGPPLSGKTTLSYMLAKKYGAYVLDVNKLMRSKFVEAKQKMVEDAKMEATEQAINQVKQQVEAAMLAAKAEEEMAAANASNEEGGEEETNEEGKEEEGEEGEGDEGAEKKEGEEEAEIEEEETITGTTAGTVGVLGEISEALNETDSVGSVEGEETTGAVGGNPVDEVDETHPEVIAIVGEAVKVAEAKDVELPAEVYAECILNAIKRVKKKMVKLSPFTPIDGGYILDNFPRTREQWTALLDKGVTIDEVLCMQDNSEGGQYLMRRHYELNKGEIEERITRRIEEERRKQEEMEEAARKAAAEEEERRRKEEEEQARLLAEEEAARKAALGEQDEEEGEGEGEEKTADDSEDEDEEDESEGVDPTSDGDPNTNTSETQNVTSTEEGITRQGDGTAAADANKAAEEDNQSEADSKADPTPYDAPEMEEFKSRKLEFEREWPQLASTIASSCPIEPKVITVDEGVTKEHIQDTAIKAIEDPFSYKGWEYTGLDMDEEEEDFENDQDGEEEIGEDEEDDEMLKKRKRPLGDTQHYCPVELKDRGVLYPGNQEIAAKYREKTYYFSTPEAREKFMRGPDQYVAKDKPLRAPPLRLFMLGPKGSGKSVHCEELCAKLGLFHISFLDRLQEMLIPKTKKRVLRTGEEDEDAEEPDDDIDGEGNNKDVAGDASKADETEPTGGDFSGETGEEEKDGSEELTEEEESIRAYLADDEPLPPDLLDQIINKWWHAEPYKSTGFILEGFPRLQDEVTYIQQAGLYPDCAIVLVSEDSDVIDRLLPPRMAKWGVRRDKRVAKKQKMMEKKQKEREEAMTKRRNELLAEREARREERRKQKVDDDDEDEEEDDIEAILAEEFEEEEVDEEEDEEQESDALERIKGDITERFEDENNKLQGVIEALDEFTIPKIEIGAGRKIKIVKFLINSRLDKMITCRQSIFERVYPVSVPLAKRLLNSGHKHPSIYGKWDPVDLLNKKACVQPLQNAQNPSFTAVYRQHVYFLSSAENRNVFTDQPRKFVSQPPPKPSIPIQIAIIGPPKSGKTTLANKFAAQFGMVRLSIGEAIRSILTSLPSTHLAAQMNEYLFRGQALPDELAVQALQCQLLDMKCQTRGFVLDGYPVTKRQIELLNEQHIVPHKVIQLQVPNDEVIIRGAKDRMSAERVLPLHDSHKILAIRLTAWQKEVNEVIEWYKREHDNFHSVDGTMSKWWVGEKSKEIAFESVRATQTYMDRTSQGKAASIRNLCITPTEFTSRLGVFGQYCPVSLALRGEFCDCSTQPNLDLAAEFRGKYYKMASQMELDEFLMNAVMYVPPLAPLELPPADELPRRRTTAEVKSLFPKRIELQGYDPVAFLDGKLRYEAIIPGDAESFVAEYRKKLYCFSSEKHLEKFLRLPEKYWNLTLPQKLPPKKQPLSVTGLPMLGYLEQTVASAIIKSLTSVGALKPKHPFLSPTRSALVYVAFHLKANNPSASEFKKKKYRQKVAQFQEKCELIHYLSNNMTLNYREPAHRPIDFDHKMASFLQLKHAQPQLNLIA